MEETIESLKSKLKDIKEELNQTIDEKANLLDDLRNANNEIRDLEIELSSWQNSESATEYDIKRNTMIGDIFYKCESHPDNDTMDIVCELMLKQKPIELQEKLKSLL